MDVQVGRIVDEIDKLGYGDNTLIFYIWGDNGSSSEGQGGTISELLAQNGIPTTVKQHIEALEELGGWMCSAHQRPILSTMRMGGPAARRIRAQSCWPRISAALVTRWHPMAGKDQTRPDPASAVSSRERRRPDDLRDLGITPPRTVNGVEQDPIDGVSFAYSFDDPKAKGQLLTQYFEVMGSRAIYRDGWMACAFGPRIPWFPGYRPAFRSGRQTRMSGNYTTSTRTGAKPTTWRLGCLRSWRR